MNFKFDGSGVFFTSDTHFNHTNIIRYCQRPFNDVAEMNETLIGNWNQTVGNEDIVFHLGDFCIGSAAEWSQILDRLNGKIYLILGKHDYRQWTMPNDITEYKSVQDVNRGMLPWLYAESPNGKDYIIIHAGASPYEFAKKLKDFKRKYYPASGFYHRERSPTLSSPCALSRRRLGQ
jgi:calcineurin-like phosphoesterase family protein